MKLNLKQTSKRIANKIKFSAKDNAPLILTGLSAVGMVATVVSACKVSRTEEVDNIILYHFDELAVAENSEKSERGKKIVRVYLKTGRRVVKAYRKPIILGTLSLGSMFASTSIMRKRNLALTAAYGAIDKAFRNYRDGVTAKYGEEVDKELRYGIREEEVTEKKKDKDGKTVTKKKKQKVLNGDNLSPFARFYEPDCFGWTKDPQANKTFLMYQEKNLTNKLRARGEGGWLSINEVYKALGMPEVPEGIDVGWVYSEKYPIGDNKVDFGIFDPNDEAKVRFVNGYEPHILLDFNFDGNIKDKIKEYERLRRNRGRK
ncbi:MAG: DUF6353 family protein [Bacillota bacterium]|nr:DUF6353 family protein [Bacillota bacterium]